MVIVVLVVFVLSMTLLALSVSGVPLSNAGYLFRGVPQLPQRDLGEKKLTANRARTVMTYGYDSLDADLQNVYDIIDEEIARSDPQQFYVGCSHEDFRRVHRAYLTDHPEVFWLPADSAGYHYWDYGSAMNVEFMFAFAGDTLQEMKKQLSDRVEKIISDAPEQASDYEIELYFNDYLTKTLTYDHEKKASMRANAYGALMNGKVVCAGYSAAFQLLCNRAGISCESVFGYITKTDGEENNTEENTLHQWNCVKLDGEWYYTDVTWNDFNDINSAHAYFNITSAEIEKTRTINPLYTDDPSWRDGCGNVIAPVCSATAYNYYNKTGTVITDLDDDNDILAVLIAASKKRDRTVDFRIGDNMDYDRTVQDVANHYGCLWIEGVNFYNGGKPALNPATKMYLYQKTHCLVLKLDYQ